MTTSPNSQAHNTSETSDEIASRVQLTSEELRFLTRHGFGLADVFDARPYPQWLWKQEMRDQGKKIAVGTHCAKEGHRLRTRGGHCAQCDPKKLAFQARYHAELTVYVAESLSAGLVKIGSCSDLWQRERQLQAERYGSIGNWSVVFWRRTKNAGLVEDTARRILSQHAVHRGYVKDGNRQTAIELLNCTAEMAREALVRAMEARG